MSAGGPSLGLPLRAASPLGRGGGRGEENVSLELGLKNLSGKKQSPLSCSPPPLLVCCREKVT